MPRVGRKIWSWLGALFAGVVILLALLTGALRVVLAQAPEHRKQIEAYASQALGMPLRIGALDARLGLAGPQVYAEDIELLAAPDGDVVVRAGSGSVAVDLWALITERRLAPGRVLLEDLVVDVVRDETGAWLIGGQAGIIPERRGEEIVVPAGEYRLENATLVLDDRTRGTGPLRFSDLELAVDSDGRSLSVEGQTRLPDSLGRRLEFWARATGGREGRHFGRIEYFVDSSDLRLEALRTAMPEFPRFPSAGTLSVRAWGEGTPREMREVTAEVEVDRLGIPQTDTEAFYERVAVGLEWNRLAGGWTAVANNLEVRRGGTTWRSPSLRVEFLQRASEPALVYLDADRLRLQDVAPAAFFVGDDLRGQIESLALEGDLENLVAQLDMDPGRPLAERARLAVRFEGLAVSADDRRPGVRGLTGRIESDERGGWLELDSIDVTAEFPGLFRAPLTADLRGMLRWRAESGGLQISSDEIVLDNRDLKAIASVKLTRPGEGPELLELDARFQDVDIEAVSGYLPVGKMTERVAGWLDRALVSGRVPTASVVWDGPLRGFPFPDGSGMFRSSLSAEDLTLDYAKGWPRAENVSADIVFENASLRADIERGTLGAVVATDVTVTIPDLPAGELRIVGDAGGPSEAVARFAEESPLEDLLGYGLAEARIAEGSATAKVDLFLPLKDLPRREIAVDLAVQGVSYSLGPMTHPVEDIVGEVKIRNASVVSQAISASVLGRPLSMVVSPRSEGGTVLGLDGRFGASEIERLLRVPISGIVEGDAQLRAGLHFPTRASGQRFFIEVSTDLTGAAVRLPAPLGKTAELPRPLNVVMRWPETGSMVWDVNYGSDLQSVVRFSLADRVTFAEASVRAGTGGVRPRLSGQSGLTIGGSLDVLDLDGWLRQEWRSPAAGTGSPEAAMPAGADPGSRGLLDWLAGGDLRTREFLFLGQRFSDQVLRVSRRADGWDVSAEGPALSGTLSLPYPVLGDAPIVGQLDRLIIGSAAPDGEPGGQPGSATDGAPRTVDARSIPAMDMSIASLAIGTLSFQNVAFTSTRLPDGFRVGSATASGPGYTLSSKATVRQSDTVDWSEWQLELTSDNIASAMESLGFRSGIDAKKGSFRFSTHWAGGLRSDWLAVTEGTARIDLGKGELEHVEPGAGRVFGLLSVQALPRRLALDFRDVFKSGFQFDDISGDFTIREGQAYTSNLIVHAPAADVGIVGRVGLANRDYDQTAVVSTELGATLPIAGVLAGGPAIGAALFVIAEIFKEPMKGMVKAQYRITGPWESPKVDRVLAAAGDGDDEGAG
jgi:uncharacterized protein (TIGR02099 family)